MSHIYISHIVPVAIQLMAEKSFLPSLLHNTFQSPLPARLCMVCVFHRQVLQYQSSHCAKVTQ
jgi:hypothetical protein